MIPDDPLFRFTLNEECQYHSGKGKRRVTPENWELARRVDFWRPGNSAVDRPV